MSIFVSTSCLSSLYPYYQILDVYNNLGFNNVELGILKDPSVDVTKIIKRHCFNYIVHHFFPPPKKPFIINLASQNKNILTKSVAQLKKSIDFCAEFNINLFSFHSGFRVDPDPHLKFTVNNIPSYDISFDTFRSSLETLVAYAENNNVKIAIENNVISEYNFINGENKFLLMCELHEFERLFNEISSPNLGILLDLGHLKVTSNLLGFDKNVFIRKIQNKIFAVHVHDNNGKIDEHKCPSQGSWVVQTVGKFFEKNKFPVILESKCTTLHMVKKAVDVLSRNVKN
jgi:sugar phosphate isomerase/epimerase